jgi:hypothetical protein
MERTLDLKRLWEEKYILTDGSFTGPKAATMEGAFSDLH